MRSISVKLILAFLIVGSASMALVVLVARWTTLNEFDQFIFNRNREGFVTQLSEYYKVRGSWEGVGETLLPLPPVPFLKGRHWADARGPITLLDKDGVVMIAGQGHHMGDHVSTMMSPRAVPIEVDGDITGWVLMERGAFQESRAELAFLSSFNQTMVLSGIGAGVVALFLGVFLARALTQPVRELTAATRELAEGNLGRQVPVRSQDELGELADSFNKMSAELARSIELRRQMTADVAHELRTPISVILGHAEAIHEGALPASPETMEAIRDEAARLERLIEDLRTITRADAGELTLIRQWVTPTDLLQQAATAYQPQARQKDIELMVRAPSDLPQIFVDPDRIAQVLANLVSNAIRHAHEQGRVVLSGSQSSKGVELRVQDNGPGIENEELTRIFDRFYRTGKSRSRDKGGSGLGLAIAKSIVENHGGRIWAESEIGAGTVIACLFQVDDLEVEGPDV
jgi:two-component system sensor histidine kinase BaeS